MKHLLKYFKPYIGWLIALVLLLILQAVTDLYLPELNADIINNGIIKQDTDYIWRTGGLMLAITLIVAFANVAVSFVSGRAAMAFGRDLRAALFKKIETFSLSELDRFGTPSLITRTNNDVQQVSQAALMFCRMMVSAPIMCAGGIFMAIRQDAPLSLLMLVIVPVILLVLALLMRKALPLFKIMQKKTDRLNLVAREKLSGIRVIRAFRKTEFEEKRFEDANNDLTMTSLRVHRMMAVLMPVLMLVMNFSTLAIYWFGSKRIDTGEMPIGNLSAFLMYIMLILFSIMMAAIVFVMLPRASASADRIQEVLAVEPNIHDPKELISADSIGDFRELTFDDVGFSYPGAEEPVLSHISFTTRPGEVTAILGSTGSGKSTLINLIPRFYDVTSGRILINGTDIRSLSQKDLRDRIGFIPQKAFLFSGTVGSNVRYGKDDATEEEIWKALEVAQAKEFVEEMTDRLDAPISQGGSNVSGGQKQRLAIARALVKRPDVYVFDDSFSALDFKTDAALREALRRETAKSAVLIVAQRVSTVFNADRILVLDDGSVVGDGTHRDLMRSCDVYREIVYSQLSEEEIA
jgi:ATP-binding cassette subfamily B protein